MVNGLEETYAYDKRNRLTAQEKNGVHTEFRYDAAGNLVKDDTASYTYDAFNRNTRVETFDGNIQINRYDAEGLRHGMEENGKLVQFIFRGTEVVAEETQEEKIRYIRTHELLASDAESARTYYYYASDEMGSITHVTAGNEVLNRYEYDAWGNAEVCEEQVANRFRFNGQQYDPVSQQYYLRARFYNPVIARFTQEDTYRGDGLNLYAYCRNNPVYYVDPSGHFCEGAADRIGGLIDEGRIKGKNRSKLEDYLRKQQESGQITPWEKNVAEKLGIKDASNIRGILSDYLGVPETNSNGFFYSIKNTLGADIYVSVDEITPSNFADIIEKTEGKIDILSGVHGDEAGNVYKDETLYYYDITHFQNGDVAIHNFTTLSAEEISGIINSGNTVICAWCFSERNPMVRMALKRGY